MTAFVPDCYLDSLVSSFFILSFDSPLCSSKLVPNPLHVLQENLLTASVVEFRSAAIGVASDSLSGFQGAVIFQKIRDTGRAERVRRIVCRQSGLLEPPFKVRQAKLRRSC